MHVISELEYLYGSDALHKMYILLLNAGGLSQRLPCATVMGKLFTPLPYVNSFFQLFDYKMACYLPFLMHMKPGYFHAAADTIETFALGEPSHEDFNFEQPGFTAVGHVSPLSIGATHGVFVLDEKNRILLESTAHSKIALLQNCSRVLQKPTIDVMKAAGATFTFHIDGQQKENNDGCKRELMVLTDSCFFFDHSVADKLMLYYRANAPLNCEIDSYGDFLQALGPQATIDYTNDLRNVTTVEPRLVKTRQEIYDLLKGSPFRIATLLASEFYHLGTFDEYLQHLCSSSSLSKELDLGRQSFNKFISPKVTDAKANNKSFENSNQINGCIMHSILSSESIVSTDSIIEYCWFDIALSVSNRCILSNCFCFSKDLNLKKLPNVFHIPQSTFMHSVPLLNSKCFSTGWVTVLFNVSDNLKRSFDRNHVDNVPFLGKSLLFVMSRWCLKNDEVFDDFNGNQQSSLWHAKLFPVAKTATESFEIAFLMLNVLENNGTNDIVPVNSHSLVSMADIVTAKDVVSMMNYRKSLYKQIAEAQLTECNAV